MTDACAAWTHPYTVLLSVLLPVVPRVAEHQQVRRQPIGAAVAALGGDSGDPGALAQVDLQPLVPVGRERGPTSGPCTGRRGEEKKKNSIQ